MDINEIQDLKSTVDRIGDRQFATTEKKIKFAIVLVMTLMVGWVLALQYQSYMQSFATTKVEMVRKFYPIPNVPMWKIVMVNENE